MISNDPAWWPVIDAYHFLSYFVVAACVGVMYDWALTFGQEVELIWMQPWSLMTVLYLSVRYLGLINAVLDMQSGLPTILLTDTECFISYLVRNWIGVLVFALLWAIIIVRLYAMYQRSRTILIFLIVASLAVNIFNAVAVVLTTTQSSGEELVLSGTYQCSISSGDNIITLDSISWILGTVWEVLTLSLAVWIAVTHIRELPQYSPGGIMGDCFSVLIQTHMFYFASFVAVSCFQLIINFAPLFSSDDISPDTQIYYGLLEIFQVVQTCVLGPRLILGLREYHAKLVADSDAATGMTSIAFQERVHISTGGGV
jgi:hypothetical protein